MNVGSTLLRVERTQVAQVVANVRIQNGKRNKQISDMFFRGGCTLEELQKQYRLDAATIQDALRKGFDRMDRKFTAAKLFVPPMRTGELKNMISEIEEN